MIEFFPACNSGILGPLWGNIHYNWVRKGKRFMPLIEIHLLEGRSDEQKKTLLKAWIQEMPPKEFLSAGVLPADRKK